MNFKNRFFEKILDVLIVIDSLVSLLLLSGVIGGEGISFEKFSSLFSIATILAFFYYLLEALLIWNRKNGMFFPMMKYILITTITFCTIFGLIFMSPFYSLESDNVKLAYVFMHYALPILMILEYIFSTKGHFKKAHFTIYLFLMILYGGVSFLLGTYLNTGYPYAFMNPEQLTYKVVGEEAVLLFVIMFIYGFIILSIDKCFRKKKRK